jgi:hypothetical protein
MTTPISQSPDRLDAWFDGSAICVVAVSGAGDPLDLAEHEVEGFVTKLQACLKDAQAPNPQRTQHPASSLRQSWAITLRHIAASRFYLPEHMPTEAAVHAERNMVQYLHRNELGLALSEAEALGLEVEAQRSYWHELRLAASNMGLFEDAARLAEHDDA